MTGLTAQSVFLRLPAAHRSPRCSKMSIIKKKKEKITLAVYQAVMKQIHLKKLQVSSLVILVHSPGSHFCTTLSLFSLPAALQTV